MCVSSSQYSFCNQGPCANGACFRALSFSNSQQFHFHCSTINPGYRSTVIHSSTDLDCDECPERGHKYNDKSKGKMSSQFLHFVTCWFCFLGMNRWGRRPLLQEENRKLFWSDICHYRLLYCHFYVTAGIYCLLLLLECHGDKKWGFIPDTNTLVAQAEFFSVF